MIFSSIPMDNLRFEAAFTTFDHVHLTASFGQLRPKAEPSMKDHILGSDEYLIRAQETISQQLERYGNGPLHPEEERPQEEEPEGIAKHADENLAVHNIYTGRTSLHVFNRIVQELQGIHHQISRKRNEKQRGEVRMISQQLFQLKQSYKRSRQEEEKRIINERIADIQQQLGNDIEAKDKAAQMRISNFYRT
jgi:hypothetical protein